LKFSESLPTDLAVDTAARRMVDVLNADRVLVTDIGDRQQPAQI